MRVLLVDPDLARANANRAYLRSEGVDVTSVSTRQDATRVLRRQKLDLVVVAPAQSDVIGSELVDALRARATDVLVLATGMTSDATPVVSSQAATSSSVLDEECYSSKLLALIRIATRARCGLRTADLQVGNLSLFLERREASVNGQPVPLTPKEFGMLELLLLRRNTVLGREAFLEHLYGNASESQPTAIIDVFICRLRRKLDQAGARDVIVTVWGRGYIVYDEGRDRKLNDPLPQDPTALQRKPRTLLPA